MSDGRHWFDKTMDSVKRASEAGVDLVQRNVRQASIHVDLSALRKSLDAAHRDVGRVAVERLRAAGTVTPDEVAHLLRRVDDLEDQIAGKERQLADLETDPAGKTPEPPPAEAAGSRKRPSYSGGSPEE